MDFGNNVTQSEREKRKKIKWLLVLLLLLLIGLFFAFINKNSQKNLPSLDTSDVSSSVSTNNSSIITDVDDSSTHDNSVSSSTSDVKEKHQEKHGKKPASSSSSKASQPSQGGQGSHETPKPPKIPSDSGATDIEPPRTNEEIVKELNGIVSQSCMTVSIRPTIFFQKGNGSGMAMIINDKVNHYAQTVKIYPKNSKTLLYQSGAIPVDSRVEYIKLNSVLAKGVYDGMAEFISVDPKTGAEYGKIEVEIKINILD